MACEKHFQDREQDSGGRHAVLQRDVARHAEGVLVQRRGPADDGDGVRRAGSITGAVPVTLLNAKQLTEHRSTPTSPCTPTCRTHGTRSSTRNC